MKLIAETNVRRFLVEFDEDEAAELIGTDIENEIVRAEGADNRPRLWIDEDEILHLVDAVYGSEGGKDFRRMLAQLYSVKAN